MSLIIEDGTLPAGADSFASLDDLRAYVGMYGGSIPSGDAECEQLLRSSAVEMWNRPWAGVEVMHDQPLPWPRAGVFVAGVALTETAIPSEIKRGQMALAVEMYADRQAGKTADGRVLVGKSIAGAISYTWSETQRAAMSSGRRSAVLFSRYLATRSGTRMVRG